MTICMYRDQLIPFGTATEEDCNYDNLIDFDVPENWLYEWYTEVLEKCPKGTGYRRFINWWANESTADDMDGFIEFLLKKKYIWEAYI